MGQTQQSSVQFLAIGDWGMDTDHQKWIANQMALVLNAEKGNVDNFFVVALGDNFYENGVESTDDPKWYNVFTTPFSEVQCPWYPVLGNHDWEGNAQAQIDFRTDGRWQMENIYYTKSFGAMIELVFIDTSTLCPDISNMYTGCEFSLKVQSDQFKWLEKTLAYAKRCKKWVIVLGHYPIHSGGCSGSIKEMQKVNTLLQKYDVGVYISGHDHSLQHLYSQDSKIHYFVSGSGCESVSVNSRPDLTKFCSEKEGFMSFTITPSSNKTTPHSATSTDNVKSGGSSNGCSGLIMNVKFICHDGTELYSVDIEHH